MEDYDEDGTSVVLGVGFQLRNSFTIWYFVVGPHFQLQPLWSLWLEIQSLPPSF
jgi:hypothetical protein